MPVRQVVGRSSASATSGEAQTECAPERQTAPNLGAVLSCAARLYSTGSGKMLAESESANTSFQELSIDLGDVHWIIEINNLATNFRAIGSQSIHRNSLSICG
jgi:hypothetical protein